MKRLLMLALMILISNSANATETQPMSMACSGITVNEYYDWQGRWINKPTKTLEKFNLIISPGSNSMTIENAAGLSRYSGLITISTHYILDGNWPDQDRINHFITLFINRQSGEYRLTTWTDRARSKELVQSYSTQSLGVCQPNRYWK